MAILYLALTVGALWAARRLRMPALNGISAFMVPWCVLLSLASIPGVMKPAIANVTWAIIFVATISLVTGVFAGWSLARRMSPGAHRLRNASIQLRHVRRWHWIFVAALASYTLLQVARYAPVFVNHGGWNALVSGNGSMLKSALIDASQKSSDAAFGTTGLLLAMLGYVLFLGNLSLFSGVFMIRAGHPIAAVVPLVIAGFYSVVTLQRTTFVMAVLFMGASWVVVGTVGHTTRRTWKSLRIRPKSAGGLAAMLVTVAAGIVALLYPLALRTAGTRNPKGLTSLLTYSLSGIAGLNARSIDGPDWHAPLVHGTTGPMPGFGSYTFSGLFSILARLGAPVPQSPINLDFRRVILFGTSTTTNVTTSLGDYFLDFRWVGVIAISLALALLTGYLHRSLVETRRIVYLPAITYLLASSLWSFFASSLLGDFRFLVLALVGGPLLSLLVGGESTLVSAVTGEPTIVEPARRRATDEPEPEPLP